MNTMNARILCFSRRQRGIALIISMLMLLILTLIGVTAMLMTVLEEKMSGNQRDRSLAFQAAESALRQGETALAVFMSANPPSSAFNCTVANSVTTCNLAADVTTASVWSSSSAQTYSPNLPNVSSQPQYLIEVLYDGASQSICKPSILSGAACQPGPFYCYYRITARGVGGSSTAVVIVQSYYIYPPATNGACHG